MCSATARAVMPRAYRPQPVGLGRLDASATTMKRFVFAAATLLAAAPWAAADPLDSAVNVPGLRYQSAFSDYRPYAEVPRADWREVNRTVEEAARKSGGAHAGHGAAASGAAPAKPSASGGSAKPDAGHQGHGMHGGAK